MAFEGFRSNCVLRIVLIVVTALGGVGLLVSGRYATSAVVGALLAYQAWSLARYVDFTNRKLELFLRSIEFADFSHRLSPGPAGKSFGDLAARLDEATESFRKINSAREESLRYLHSVVQHIGIGLVAFDQKGKVELLNPAAKTLLDVPALRSIDDLQSVSPKLHGRLRALRPGKRDLVTVALGGRLLQLSLRATELRRQREVHTIVSIQNISPELNEKEMEAWRNLIRVLTHEIRNSLTPIASLAASVEQMVVPGKGESDVREALQAIQRRSDGLLQFVNAYRDLTHIPQLELESIKVGEMLEQVLKVVAPQPEQRTVRLRAVVRPEEMRLTADPRLIEQVLVNVVLNALQATERQADAEIVLEATIDAENRAVIRVTDNGPGIVGDSLEKIFVPFYSTRQGGSGIGLSLSRQIMRMHRGDLTVRSEPGVKTTFSLQF